LDPPASEINHFNDLEIRAPPPRSAAAGLSLRSKPNNMNEHPTPDSRWPDDGAISENDPGAPAEASPGEAELQARLAELQAKNAEIGEQYLRAQAEMQNTRRRADEEISKARKYAVESFAESMLPVADSLEAGLAVKDAPVEVIREGAEATLRQLKSALERNKVIEINPESGTKFDPHRHQAISVVPAEQEANTVVTVLQKGYSISDRVLRPALVTVTAPG
jgi:molecular chaperone GrpE